MVSELVTEMRYFCLIPWQAKLHGLPNLLRISSEKVVQMRRSAMTRRWATLTHHNRQNKAYSTDQNAKKEAKNTLSNRIRSYAHY